jgi:cellulose synthase/poly-beta-1,6-N-acetylglucosamine synthase-like glycosyltransferase
VSALDVKSQNQIEYQHIDQFEPSKNLPQGLKLVVVIPAYNEARFIGSTVLKALDFTNCVLVVDDRPDCRGRGSYRRAA